MLNLRNDPDLSSGEIEFATWLESAVQPITAQSALLQSTMVEPTVVQPPVVQPPVDLRATRRTRRRRAAIALTIAAAFGTLAVIARPKSDATITALYAAPPIPQTPAMYLPVNLPAGMKIVSVQRPVTVSRGQEFFFGRVKNEKVENFTMISLMPDFLNMLDLNSASIGTERFEVDGTVFFEEPHPSGTAAVRTKLGRCGWAFLFSPNATQMQLAQRAKLVRCEDAKPLPTGELGFALLYERKQPTEETLRLSAEIKVSTRNEMVTVIVGRIAQDPLELRDLFASLPAAEGQAGISPVNVAGEMGAVVSLETAGGISQQSVSVLPKADPTALITVLGKNKDDVTAVAESIRQVDEQTWQSAWK